MRSVRNIFFLFLIVLIAVGCEKGDIALKDEVIQGSKSAIKVVDVDARDVTLSPTGNIALDTKTLNNAANTPSYRKIIITGTWQVGLIVMQVEGQTLELSKGATLFVSQDELKSLHAH